MFGAIKLLLFQSQKMLFQASDTSVIMLKT